MNLPQTVMTGAALTCALAGCGGAKHFANQPRPPSPVNLTVEINDSRVSVSPTAVGAGPVVLIVTNAASRSESLRVADSPDGKPLADTGPISPQATATVAVDLQPGDYFVATARSGSPSQSPSTIQPAQIHLGAARPNGSDLLLQP